MGRELKRVPLDFSWPQGVIWKGFLNPYRPTECDVCEGEGYNEETREIARAWYDFEGTGRSWRHDLEQNEVDALIEHGRLWDLTHNDYKPTAEEVNEWSKSGFGHDALNRGICVEARAKARGVYGLCPLCDGRGHYWCEEKYEELWDSWKEIEPPGGEGYQLWSTTTEGHPMSPAFESLDALCEWLEVSGASVFGDSTTSKERWKQMLHGNFVYHQEGNNIFL